MVPKIRWKVSRLKKSENYGISKLRNIQPQISEEKKIKRKEEILEICLNVVRLFFLEIPENAVEHFTNGNSGDWHWNFWGNGKHSTSITFKN